VSRVIAALLVLTAAACSTQPSVPDGSLTAHDLGTGWRVAAVDGSPTFDVGCETDAFDGTLPDRIVPASAVETEFAPTGGFDAVAPGHQKYADEYLMLFHNRAAAERALHRYIDVAKQCISGTPTLAAVDDGHLVQGRDGDVLTSSVAHLVNPDDYTSFDETNWSDFRIVGHRAFLLFVDDGPQQFVVTIAARAAKKLK
jgi:hypothetical protein